MTLESGHAPTEWESAPRPSTQSVPAVQAAHYNSARHGSHVEESPELLRWRADLLMDEMMMGGVDVSAADSHRTFSGVDSPVTSRPQQAQTNGVTYNNSSVANGRSSRESYERNGYHNADHANGSRTNGAQSNGNFQPTETPRDFNSGSNGVSNGVVNGGINGGSYPSAPAQQDFAGESLSPNEEPYPSTSASTPPLPPTSASPSPSSYSTPRPESSYSSDDALRPPPTRPVPPTSLTDERNESGVANYPFESNSGVQPPSTSQPAAEQYPRPYSEPSPVQSTPGEEQRPTPPANPSAASELPPLQTTLRTTMDAGPVPNLSEQTARADRLYALEQQYEQFRREQSANTQPVEPQTPAASRPPLPPVQPAPAPAAPPRVPPQPVDEHTQWASGPDKWEYQDFSANPQEQEDQTLLTGYPAPERLYGQDSAVRHDPTQFVSAMAVVAASKKRSTLLPRMSTLDVDTLHREISDLHGEIAALLPVGNETSERARHLLDKAYSILQSDPMRSAEVEYYMQQVRTIVQRLHQARQWSDLYRQRLNVYLWAWVGLSAMLLIARFLFQTDMEESLMWGFGLDADSLLVEHWATFLGTMFAGALGGAIGALYTMQAHARSEYSFFDRKYGLRGLILPFMGLIVGGLGYLIFGLVFALVGIDPSQSLTAAIVPTVAAFAFGFSQESIYGTRG